jgi:hypothetical protein
MPREEIVENLCFFNDVIDGYFPLQISLSHLLERLDASLAYIEITYAPIMDIPGLEYFDPVPLNLKVGRVGMIEKLHVRYESSGNFSSNGSWHWLDTYTQEANNCFSKMIRLAEPAYVEGFYVSNEPVHNSIKVAKSIVSDDMPVGREVWGPFSGIDDETLGAYNSGSKHKKRRDYLSILYRG